MRSLFIFFIALAVCSCNSSSTKDPNQAMDDTARRRDIPVEVVTVAPLKLNVADIPSSIKVQGKVQEAWKWTDKLGENIFIVSAIAPHEEKNGDEEGSSAEIHAYHYTKSASDADYVASWVMNDEEKLCPVDLTLEFAPGSTTITDVDKNGIAEIKIQHSKACRGDVSPAEMYLDLYENGVKYALKGTMWIQEGPEFKYNVTENDVNIENLPKLKDESEEYLRSLGRYQSEKSFAGAPPEFLAYAKSEWLKYSKEKMGE